MNWDLLFESGVVYCNLSSNTSITSALEFRKLISRCFKEKHGNIVNEMKETLVDLFDDYNIKNCPDVNKILFSYENTAGSYDLSETGRIYPHIYKPLNLFKEIFGDSMYVCFSIRNYSEFIESTYLQQLKTRGKTYDFYQYLEGIDIDNFNWFEPVEKIREIAGKDRSIIWTYEGYKEKEKHILNILLGDAVTSDRMKYPSAAVNPSFSEKAMEIAKRINPVLDKEERKLMRKILEKNFGTDKNYKKPKLLPEVLQRILNEKYERDIEQIEGLIV